MTIGKKLALGYLIVVLLMVALALYADNMGQSLLQESVGKSSILLAEEMLKRVNYNLQHIVEHIKLYTHGSLLRMMILQSNNTFQNLENIQAYIEQKDAEWTAAPDGTITPFMQELITNTLSTQLREEYIKFWENQRGYPLFVEVFITNKYGVNVAQTNKTSDYYQADEEWWQVAKENGYFIGEVEYDESAQTLAIPIAVRIEDEEGEMIGIIKAVVSMTAIVREAEVAAKTYETTEIQLISAKEGKLVYATRAFQFFEDVSDNMFFKHLQGERGFFIAEEGNRKKLYCYTHTPNSGRYKGSDWILVMGHDEREVLKPVAILRKNILITSILLTVTGLLFAFFISRSITLPIGELITGTEIIGKGDLTYRVALTTKDEIGELAAAFNQMTAKHQQGVEELKKHHGHLEESVEERTAELKRVNKNLQDEIIERRQVEKALRESEKKYCSLFENMNEGFAYHQIVLDAHEQPVDYIFLDVNDAFEAYTGLKQENILGKKVTESIPGIEHAEPDLISIYGHVALTGEKTNFELYFEPLKKWYVVSAFSPFRGYFCAMFTDITERKQAEEKLQQQQERFLAIFDNFPEILYVSDPETYEVLFVNKIFEELLGRNPVGSLCYKAFQGFENPCEFCTNDIILQDRKSYIWEYHNPVLNKDYLLTDQIIKWPDGRDVRFEVAIGITDRKHAEEALRASESKYKTLVENIPQKIFTKDRNSMYISCNENFARDLGITPDEFGGKTDYDFFPNELADKYRADDQRIMEAESVENIEEKYLQDGQEFWVQTIKTPIKDEKGNVIGILGVFWDITDRKRAEEERERLNVELDQKNKELEQIVYVTSHDLRSPLVNVQGFSKELKYALEELGSLLQREDVSDEIREATTSLMEDDIQEDLKYILTGVAKMDTLLAGLLRLSRLGRAALAITSLHMNQLVADVIAAVEFQIQEAGTTLDVSDLPPCQGDALQINQVFSNLLGNALKFIDPSRSGTIRISGSVRGDQAVYCVEDNGIGIAPEHQKQIFEIFHRLNPTESPGEGLGLTIVRKILDRHNGKIWVESEVGEGSKFYVALPGSSS